MTKRRIGILSLQGAVEPHVKHLEALGCDAIRLKTSKDILDPTIEAMIIPGGESSTMLRLIAVFELEPALLEFFASKPVWGVCAGSILMARSVAPLPSGRTQKSFALMDYDVHRNAYGSQLESFEVTLPNVGRAVFIRAPQFENVDPGVEVMASHGGRAVWLVQGNYMATSFHPELSTKVPSECHSYFVNELIPRAKLSQLAPEIQV